MPWEAVDKKQKSTKEEPKRSILDLKVIPCADVLRTISIRSGAHEGPGLHRRGVLFAAAGCRPRRADPGAAAPGAPVRTSRESSTLWREAEREQKPLRPQTCLKEGTVNSEFCRKIAESRNSLSFFGLQLPQFPQLDPPGTSKQSENPSWGLWALPGHET